MKPPVPLNDEQKKMLAWLERNGAVSPSRLLAETLLEPKAVWGMLNQLSEWGLVIMRDDPSSDDGRVIVVAPTFKSSDEG